MSGYLLDTNVLSELMRKSPTSSVVERLRDVRESAVATSAVCVMELRFGAARHPRGIDLWERIVAEILPDVEVLPVTADDAILAGDLLAELEGRGERIGTEDVLIAATALRRNLTLVSRNVEHFARIPDLVLEDWWSS